MISFFKNYAPILILLVLFSCIVLMCSVPPVSRDALTHHLFVPKLYVEKGLIHELPFIIPSYYPELIDLIYCIPLMLKNDITPKYIHFGFALLTALSIFLYLKHKIDRFHGTIGTLFFLSLPVIVKLSITVYVDLALIFFSTASLLCLLQWREKKFQTKWLIYSAFFCGLCLSTKYNGLITCFLLTAFTPLIYLKKQDRPFRNRTSIQIKAAGYGLGFLLIATAIFSPWMIKNYKWTHNPVYPLYDSFFNPVSQSGVQAHTMKPAMKHFLIRKLIYKESWIETAAIPVRIFFQGEDDNPKFFDGKLNPLLFLLPFFAFFYFRQDNTTDPWENKILGLFSVLYILIVFFQQDMRIRWIGPAIPPLVILSVLGLKNINSNFTRFESMGHAAFNRTVGYIRIGVLLLIFSTACLNGKYIYHLFHKIDPIPYMTQQVSRQEYIEKFRPEYPVLEYANRHLDGNIKLLAFFLGNRGYYSDHDIRFDNAFFMQAVKGSTTALDILNKLKITNYSHLIVDYPMFNDWVDRSFGRKEKKRVQDFFNQYTKLIFSKNRHGLYQLSESSEPLSSR